uniref:Uncharacterized protein n=1 Tax=Physcomitrium patens TaxID=3218 RepID=A0A2K1J2H1_PHYPA|nr:hypothetical protein PHYPA_021573 [Physcomitrium patens]
MLLPHEDTTTTSTRLRKKLIYGTPREEEDSIDDMPLNAQHPTKPHKWFHLSGISSSQQQFATKHQTQRQDP